MADFTACCHDFRLYADLFSELMRALSRDMDGLALASISVQGVLTLGIVYRNA